MVPSLVTQLLSWFLLQYSLLSRLKLAWGSGLPPSPVSSPPQVELILLSSPSCYLIAEEPELVPPWVWLLCRQDQCCFLGSAVATGIHSPHRRDVGVGVGVGGRPGELSAQEVGYKLFSLREWESWLRCLATSTLGKG